MNEGPLLPLHAEQGPRLTTWAAGNLLQPAANVQGGIPGEPERGFHPHRRDERGQGGGAFVGNLRSR